MEKLKLPPINIQQKRLMVEYVQKYPNLAKQKFSADFTLKKAQKHWEELAQILNSVPGGSKKSWIQWRKTWTDIKKNTKNKVATVQLYTQGTGGGPAIPKEKEVTDLEKNILEIIGNVVQRGHENVTETPIEFNFDNEGEENIIIEVMESVNDGNINRTPSQEMDFHLDPVPSTLKGVKKRLFETPSSRWTDKTEDEPIFPKMDLYNDNSMPSCEAPSNKEKVSSKIVSEVPSVKSNKPSKYASGGKRLSVTRRLENSQKATADMLKSIESRTSIMEQYYEKKGAYLEHMKEYHEKKLQLQEKNNTVLKEILLQAKEKKICLCGEKNGSEKRF